LPLRHRRPEIDAVRAGGRGVEADEGRPLALLHAGENKEGREHNKGMRSDDGREFQNSNKKRKTNPG
ncbi:hypothetical protein AVEN_61263-1, partial [Araneus ventricosus]